MAAALATVVLACQDGAGRPGPAWTPPAWVQGTWTWTGATGPLTMEASARNVQVAITGGGVTVTVGHGELAEEGIATIEYRAGIYSGTGFRGQTGRRYYWVNAEGADLGAGHLRRDRDYGRHLRVGRCDREIRGANSCHEVVNARLLRSASPGAFGAEVVSVGVPRNLVNA